MPDYIPFDKIPLPDVVKPYAPMLFSALYGLIILVIGWLVSKTVNSLALKALRRAKVDEALTRFLASIAQYVVLVATVITALGKVGVETTSLVTILASAGLAIGLALQGSLSNFASGVMILFFRPFVLGDRVTTGGHTGIIDDIGIFSTAMLTPANEKVIIPNSAVTSNTIVNFSATGTLRATIDVGVAYGADIKRVEELLKKAAAETELVLAEPEPLVLFTGLGASSLDFKVFASAQTPDFAFMQHNLRTNIYDRLNQAEIEIPFNQIVVHQSGS